MKNKFKNIAAAIMISALFFVPVFCSAQTGGGTVNDFSNIEPPPLNETTPEEEELLYLEVMYYQQTQTNTVYENADQKTYQHFSLICTVLKAAKEMKAGKVNNLR